MKNAFLLACRLWIALGMTVFCLGAFLCASLLSDFVRYRNDEQAALTPFLRVLVLFLPMPWLSVASSGAVFWLSFRACNDQRVRAICLVLSSLALPLGVSLLVVQALLSERVIMLAQPAPISAITWISNIWYICLLLICLFSSETGAQRASK